MNYYMISLKNILEDKIVMSDTLPTSVFSCPSNYLT